MRYFSIYLLLIVVFSINAGDGKGIKLSPAFPGAAEHPALQQRYDKNYSASDSLFAKYYDIYNDSLVVYQRLLSDDISLNEEVHWQLEEAAYLKKKQWYDAAAKAYARVDKAELNDSLKYHFYYEAALCYYLSQRFEEAGLQFILMGSSVRDTGMMNRSLPLQALIYNELGEWNLAHTLLDSFLVVSSKGQKSGLPKSLDSLYSRHCQPKLKSPDKAKMLNSVLPGLGFLYAGNIAEGIVNTGFQVALLGLTGVGWYYHYYISSIFGTAQVFLQFYKGGRNRASFLAEKRNYKLKKEYNAKLKTLILQL